MSRVLGIAICWVVIFTVVPSQALEVRSLGRVALSSEVVQMTAAADGKRFYLLLDDGTVQLLGQDGRLLNAIRVGRDVEEIEAMGTGRLLLLKKNRSEIEIVVLIPRSRSDADRSTDQMAGSGEMSEDREETQPDQDKLERIEAK